MLFELFSLLCFLRSFLHLKINALIFFPTFEAVLLTFLFAKTDQQLQNFFDISSSVLPDEKMQNSV